MKKIITFCAVMLLMLSLAACGKSAEPVQENQSSNPTQIESVEENQPSEYSVEEVGFERDRMHIYGEIYLPKIEGPLPVVILSHGFGGDSNNTRNYAKVFAENGIAACTFDFIGGGSGSKSDGKMTEMSVLTEAADLNAVIDSIIKRDDIDASELYLFGGSQGGFVSTYVACTRPDDIKGLIALYPAYVIHDDAWSRTPDPNNIPETMNLMGMTIGRIYNHDAMSFDIYDMMKDYPKDVLLIHGTNDGIVPINYSERAVEIFPSAELIKLEGAEHGFYGNDETQSAEMSIEFIKEHLGKEIADSSVTDKDDAEKDEMKIKVSDGTNEVIFRLNDTSTAKSLYAQLPLTIEVENYSSNEKIFYPPEKLDTTDVIESDGPFGTLAYFSPWGNVVMYYSPCGEYPGLYIMGEAIEGENNIEKLSGTIDVTVGE